ncbi:MAG TPA: hypothetical protein VJ650_07410 [Gemmatimonadaceae bacterium]|nr:hypothetical protein [Gemmatimonadaceae bacterium]
MRTRLRVVVATATVTVFLIAGHARGQGQAAAVTCSSGLVAAVADSVAEAFDKHQFVFIGSTHGGRKAHDFLLCLLSRPAFQSRVTDVLVEWANPVHQAQVDRYLLRLEPVPLDSLRRVWFDTDAPRLWARLPLIPEFYERVRSMNARVDFARRIRVLGGCEPIDWSSVNAATDVAMYPFKNNWAAHVITEHFAPDPRRRLLVVYGDGHIHHSGGHMMAQLAVALDRARLFVLGTIESSEPTDRDGVGRIGDATRPFYLSRGRLPSAGPYPRALFYANDEPLADHVDAVAYLGPERDRDLSNQTALTQEEEAEVRRRDAIKGDLQQLMQLRFGNRDRWFRSHPNELPRDPRRDSSRDAGKLR